MGPPTTRQRILAAAVRLFNRRGVTKVTIRQIADEIGISPGNLAYHYKNKEYIIDDLYTRMADEMADAVFPVGDLTLAHYQSLLKRITAFHRKYKFFYMDMLEIARQYPRVIQRYRETITVRSRQSVQLIDHFMARGLIGPEPAPGFYESLFHSVWIVSTFWQHQEKILGAQHPLVRSGSVIKHVWEMLLPHLTDAGLREYEQLARQEPAAFPPLSAADGVHPAPGQFMFL